MITGPAAAIDAILATLRPHFQAPVREWSADSPLPVTREAATFLISDVATLSLEQQRGLLAWLQDAVPGHPQVVATTPLELFPLVECGTFLEALYYRLNTIRLDVS